MPEHLTTQQIENLATRRLAADEIVAATRHIAVCEECRQRVDAQANAVARVASLRATFGVETGSAHLNYEQMVAYVEDTTDSIEREIIVNHLDACRQCTTEMEELAALRDDLTKTTAEPPGPSLLDWLRNTWQSQSWFRPMPLTAFAAALVLLIAVVWWSRKPAPAPAPTIAAQPSPAATQPAPSPLSPSPVPTAPPAVIAALNDKGRQIALDQAGNVTGLPDLSKEAERAVRQALEKQQSEISPEIKQLLRRPATLMSGTDEQQAIKLHSPIGTFVQDTQPTFRWQVMPGAQNYTVLVLDENFNVVATSPPRTQAFWRATASLKRGQEYIWQVTAEVDGKRVTSASASTPEAHFKILPAEKARELQTLLQSHDSHLLRGSLYAKAGLLDEAEREYQALLKANPHSIVARKLLQHLRAVRKS